MKIADDVQKTYENNLYNNILTLFSLQLWKQLLQVLLW